MLTPSLINIYVGSSNIKLFICDVSEYCNISNGNFSHSFSKLNPDSTISCDVVGLLLTHAEVCADPSPLVYLLSQVEPRVHIFLNLIIYHRICCVTDPPTQCYVMVVSHHHVVNPPQHRAGPPNPHDDPPSQVNTHTHPRHH